jgi:hypothetical protein
MGWVDDKLFADALFGRIVKIRDGSAIVRPVIGKDAIIDRVGLARLGDAGVVGTSRSRCAGRSWRYR